MTLDKLPLQSLLLSSLLKIGREEYHVKGVIIPEPFVPIGFSKVSSYVESHPFITLALEAELKK